MRISTDASALTGVCCNAYVILSCMISGEREWGWPTCLRFTLPVWSKCSITSGGLCKGLVAIASMANGAEGVTNGP